MTEPAAVTTTAIPGLPEITPGFALGQAISELIDLDDGDIVAISQKAVSKAEGRIVALDSVTPGAVARELAERTDKDPRLVELILGEARTVVRVDAERGIVITETAHGFVCANSGIDSSNLPGDGSVVLLPRDSDASCRRLRDEIEGHCGKRPGVLISDSLGRAWRLGQAEMAIGTAGVTVIDDWRGQTDRDGRVLAATKISVADQIAGAADLARSKVSGTPAVRLRGLDRFVTVEDGPGVGVQIRPAEDDLFR